MNKLPHTLWKWWGYVGIVVFLLLCYPHPAKADDLSTLDKTKLGHSFVVELNNGYQVQGILRSVGLNTILLETHTGQKITIPKKIVTFVFTMRQYHYVNAKDLRDTGRTITIVGLALSGGGAVLTVLFFGLTLTQHMEGPFDSPLFIPMFISMMGIIPLGVLKIIIGGPMWGVGQARMQQYSPTFAQIPVPENHFTLLAME